MGILSLISILFYVAILLLIIAVIYFCIKKQVSGLKMVLVGMNITLFGGIIVLDPNSYLAGVEYLIAFMGIIISIIGLVKKD